MIFLLNYERVRFEVVELTRLRMAEALHLDPKEIEVAYEKDQATGEVAKGWTVKSLPEGMTADQVQKVLVTIGRHYNQHYLVPRLLDARRTAREARGGA